MSRKRESEAVLSLDSFLDIVTNVVGVLILVAVVTVLGTGDIGISAGPSALYAPKAGSTRYLFEIVNNEVFYVDESGIAKKVQDEVKAAIAEKPSAEAVSAYLNNNIVGNEFYRIRGEIRDEGLVWVYSRKPDVSGENKDTLPLPHSAFRQKLDRAAAEGAFVYFVVHEQSFDAFQKARELTQEKGVSMGWHPVPGTGAIRMAQRGTLGNRIQ
ncbi:MAG: hypothetical protein IPK82_02565 [Polyangiaceae bacterium]|nr:hypothetical protein [Polyangiaceae bacterium]